MITIQKQPTCPAPVIRAVTGDELTEYERNKLAGIEEHAQENKIEVIRINDKKVPVNSSTKTANIKLGNLAFKSVITPGELSTGECFFIKCELDESTCSNN